MRVLNIKKKMEYNNYYGTKVVSSLKIIDQFYYEEKIISFHFVSSDKSASDFQTSIKSTNFFTI